MRMLQQMAVPRMSQLRHGVSVNVVLKADQPSGKLTTGQVSDILTKGDHPRGIKVRLSDGQVGRVQSLASASLPSTSAAVAQNVPEANPRRAIGDRGQRSRYKFQNDYREDPAPADSLSLGDYVRIKPARKKGAKNNTKEQVVAPQETTQEQLEAEFPSLDTALVAAIVGDNHAFEDARQVLRSIS